MATSSVTLRQLSRHIHNQPPIPLKLRQTLRLGNVGFHLQVERAPFSLMTHNMALMVGPAPYKGTDREGAIEEIISRIVALSPDVVGLCEVFADGERETIRDRLRDIYPHFQEGPDEADLESDGGLLLLSKHPMPLQYQIIYRDCAGDDCFANKGIIYARVHPPNSPTPYDIFYSHTQNIEEGGGKEALYAQLTRMKALIQEVRQNPADVHIPTFIMGDLNIPGEMPEHYNELIGRLGQPVDLWTVAGNPPESGFTFAADNNFYEDSDDNPHQNQRLDYILMKAGVRFIPILSKIEILKFARGGRFISDHFGLHAQLDMLVKVDF